MKRLLFILVVIFLPGVLGNYDFCDYGENGTGISIVSIEDKMKDNSEKWVWEWGDSVAIEIGVLNNFTNDSFAIELAFIDEDNETIDIVNDEDDLKQVFYLENNTEDTISFVFEINENIIEKVYNFYVKIYKEGNEESVCVEDSVEFQIKDDVGIFVKSVSGPKDVNAGSSVSYSVIVENLGSKLEDQVIVYVYNSNLKINQEYVLYNLSVGASKEFNFEIIFSENIPIGPNVLAFSVEYDYDKEKDVYLSSYNDEKTYVRKYFVNVLNEVSIETLNNTIEDEVLGEDVNQSSLNVGDLEPIVDDKKSYSFFSKENKYLVYLIFGGLFVFWIFCIGVLFYFFHNRD